MKTTTLPEQPEAKSPAGAEIRFIMDGETGNMIHSTVPAHQVNRATVHASVSEFWYVLEGRGEIWRDDGVESCVDVLVPGPSIDIPVGTAFQCRNVGDEERKVVGVTMPPWPGDTEATYLDGVWQPSVGSSRRVQRQPLRHGSRAATSFRGSHRGLRQCSGVT